MRRWLVAALSLTLDGCYQAQALDARSVLDEVRLSEAGPDARTLRPEGHGDGGSGAASFREPVASGGVATPGGGAAPGSAPAAPRGPARDDTATEDQAVARALAWNPELRTRRHDLGVAEGQITAATALANPTVEIELLHLEAYGQEHSAAIQIGWEPPQPWVYSAKAATTRAQAAAVEREIAEVEWQTIISVRAAHASLQAVAERQALVERSLVTRRRIEDLTERRLRGGASTAIDLSIAQLSVAEMERQRETLAEQELDGARVLGELLGAGHPVHATGNGVPDEPATPPSLDDLTDAALRSRPALRAEENRFRQREEALRLEHARRWPWFKLTSLPRYRFDPFDSHRADYSVGVELTVPLLDQNAGAIRIAEATRDAERERFRGQAGAVLRELAAGLDELRQRRQTIQRYRALVLPSLDAHEALLGRAAEGGQIDLVAVLRAADGILQSRNEYVGVRLGYQQAWLRLDRAAGRHVTGAAAAPSARPPATGNQER